MRRTPASSDPKLNAVDVESDLEISRHVGPGTIPSYRGLLRSGRNIIVRPQIKVASTDEEICRQPATAVPRVESPDPSMPACGGGRDSHPKVGFSEHH